MNALMKRLAAMFLRRRKESPLWHSAVHIPPVVEQVPAYLRRDGGRVMITRPSCER